MESGKKPMGSSSSSSSSSSSFATELFGPKDSSSSAAAGYFASIFAPPSKLMGRDFHCAEVAGKKQDGKPGEGSKVLDSIFEGERGRVNHPCNLSSSLYYGGQDMYFSPQTTHTSTSYKKGVEDDDPHSASRGDWWQGSFYY